jgi:hypothetical protein
MPTACSRARFALRSDHRLPHCVRRSVRSVKNGANIRFTPRLARMLRALYRRRMQTAHAQHLSPRGSGRQNCSGAKHFCAAAGPRGLTISST